MSDAGGSDSQCEMCCQDEPAAKLSWTEPETIWLVAIILLIDIHCVLYSSFKISRSSSTAYERGPCTVHTTPEVEYE